MRREGFSFYGLRDSDEGGNKDLIYIIFAGLMVRSTFFVYNNPNVST